VSEADIRGEFGGANHPVTVHFGTELLHRFGIAEREPEGER